MRHLCDLFRRIVAGVASLCVSRIRGCREGTMTRNVLRISQASKAVVAITRLENHAHMAFFDIDDEIGRGGMFHGVSSLGAKTKSPRACRTGIIVCQRLAAKGFNDLVEKTQPHGRLRTRVATDP